jgi:SAM-dependent methyltransferase
MKRAAHWNTIFRSRRACQRSWTQARPSRSLALIRAARLPAGSLLLDAGCGASTLADHLVRHGRLRLALVDVSAAALRELERRLGKKAVGALFVRADLAAERLDIPVDCWHDRAVFHFLTGAADRRRYLANLRRCLRPGGFVVLATFAPSGPETCSGLPVRRYAAAGLMRELGPSFRLLRACRERHRTPFGTTQDFCYVLARRKRQDQTGARHGRKR